MKGKSAFKNKTLWRRIITLLRVNGVLLLKMLRDSWKGVYPRKPYKSLLITGFYLLYLLSPWDLIPDMIIGLGQLDDLAILLLCLNWVESDILEYKKWRAENSEVIDGKKL